MHISALAYAVFVECIPCVLLAVGIVVLDPAGADSNITVPIDAVVVTVDVVPCHNGLTALEVGRTFIVLSAVRVAVPLTGNELAVLFELVGDVTVVQSSNSGEGGIIEIVPLVVDLYPAGEELAGSAVVILAVDDLETVIGNLDLAAFAADDLSVNDGPEMTGSGNGGAPIYNRVTYFAEGSAGVAVLGAGGSLVLDGLGIVNVGAVLGIEVELVDGVLVGAHLGVDTELLVGEGAGGAVNEGDETLIDVHLHILRIEFVGSPVGSRGVAGNLDIIIEVQDANGDLREHSSAGLIVVAGTGDGDGCGVGHGFAGSGVLSGEALSELHMIELPMVDVVEVDNSLNGVDGLDRVGFEVHPIDGTEGDPVEGIVSGNELQSRSGGTGLNLDNADDDRLVACVVADFELDAVITVSNGIAVRGDNAVSISAVDLNAVDISLGGRSVDAADVVKREGIVAVRGHVGSGGSVCYGDGQIQNVVVGDYGLADIISYERSGVVEIDLIEYGLFSVVYSFRVVDGEVIEVIGERTVDGTVGLPQSVVLGSVENDHQEELAVAAFGLGELSAALESNLLVLAEVDRQIMPAGLVEVMVAGLHGQELDLLVEALEGAVAVSVEIIVHSDVALDVILGNIHPEAEGTRVLEQNRVAVYAQSDVGIFAGVGRLGMQTVGLEAQGVVAVMNLAVFCIRQGQSHVVIPYGAFSVIDDVPFVNVDLTVLKVPEHNGALAELDRYVGGGIGAHVQGNGNAAAEIGRSAVFVNSSEVQTVKAADCIVRGDERQAAGIDTDLDQTVLDGRLDRNIDSLAVRNGNNRLVEGNRFRNDEVDNVLADNGVVVQHLDGRGTFGAVRGKDAVLIDGAQTIFLNSPDYVVGNVDAGTDSVKAGGIELDRAAGGVVIIIGADAGTGKFAVCRSGRDNDDRVGGRSLTAVSHTAVDLEVFAGTLRAESGRTAAVAVRSDDAAHLDHIISHLPLREAYGVRSHFAVADNQNQGTVSLDANKGSRSSGAVIATLLINRIAVCVRLDKVVEQNGDRLLFPTGQRIGGSADPNLRHIGRTVFAGDRVLVIVDDNNGRNAAGSESAVGDTAVGIVLTVEDGVTERLTDEVRMLLIIRLGVPAQGAVGSADDITVTQLLSAERLNRGSRGAVIAVLGPQALGAGDDLDIRIVDVDRSGVDNLSAGARSIVQYDLGLVDTGCKVPFSLRDNIIVVISNFGVVVYYPRAGADRENACNQHDCEDHADHSD